MSTLYTLSLAHLTSLLTWSPAHRKVAIEEAMFQVDTSEANDETSTESGEIDETADVRKAIEDFLEDL